MLQESAQALSRRSTIIGAAALAAAYPYLVKSEHWQVILDEEAAGRPMSITPLSAIYIPPDMPWRDWVAEVIQLEWQDGMSHRALLDRLTNWDEFARIQADSGLRMIEAYRELARWTFAALVPILTRESATAYFLDVAKPIRTILEPHP